MVNRSASILGTGKKPLSRTKSDLEKHIIETSERRFKAIKLKEGFLRKRDVIEARSKSVKDEKQLCRE